MLPCVVNLLRKLTRPLAERVNYIRARLMFARKFIRRKIE